MNRSNLNVLTAILLAAGAISPAALGNQITNFDSIDDLPSVIADYQGITTGTEFIKNGVLEITSGTVGLMALNRDGFPDVYLWAEGFASELDVNIDLSQSEDAVGVLLEDGVFLYFDKSAFIKADTAIRGSDAVFFEQMAAVHL